MYGIRIVTLGSFSLRPDDYVAIWVVDLISFLMQPIQRASESQEVVYLMMCRTSDMHSGFHVP